MDSNAGIRSRCRSRMEEFISCFSEVSDLRQEYVRHNPSKGRERCSSSCTWCQCKESPGQAKGKSGTAKIKMTRRMPAPPAQPTPTSNRSSEVRAADSKKAGKSRPQCNPFGRGNQTICSKSYAAGLKRRRVARVRGHARLLNEEFLIFCLELI